MMPKQVEHVAQAFYEAEYPDKWQDAPEALQEHFRNLAATAIAILNRQIAECRATAEPAGMTYSPGPAISEPADQPVSTLSEQ